MIIALLIGIKMQIECVKVIVVKLKTMCSLGEAS